MLKLIPLVALIATTPLIAATPTAKVVYLNAVDRLDIDVPKELTQYNHSGNEEGINLTVLVSGENMVRFKKDSGIIDAISATGGVKPTLAKRAKFNENYRRITTDGTYGLFVVNLPIENATQIKGLKTKGRITLLEGSTKTKHKETVIPEFGTPAATVGKYTVSRTRKASGNDYEYIGISGPTPDLASVTFFAGGTEIKNPSSSWSDTSRSYSIPSQKGQPISVVIESFDNLKEVVVPFIYSN